jgi:glycosyltransferase involved in cell wall biosynthesis
MSGSDVRPRVLHVGKFYPPVSGGMERVLQLLCDREKAFVQSRVLVAHTGRRTVHDVVDGVPVTRAGTWANEGSVAVCPTLPLLLRREDPDVIVIHEPNPLGLVAYALARPSARLVIWFHAEVVRDLRKYALFYRPWFAHAMKRASRVIVATPPMASAAQLQGYDVPVSVIPYGVEVERLRATVAVRDRAERLRGGTAVPTVLFVGRLVPYKGLDVLVRAMREVDARLVLVGDGPLRGTLETLARDTGVASKVLFAGEVNDEELIAWYHACDVFSLPSVTRAEAFGMVQVEAMACGKPVVSTDLPTGVPWVNRDRETGLVVPPGDAEALAGALARLAADPALRVQFGDAGRRRVAQEFTAERMAARAVSLYSEVLAGDGVAVPSAAATACAAGGVDARQ